MLLVLVSLWFHREWSCGLSCWIEEASAHKYWGPQLYRQQGQESAAKRNKSIDNNSKPQLLGFFLFWFGFSFLGFAWVTFIPVCNQSGLTLSCYSLCCGYGFVSYTQGIEPDGGFLRYQYLAIYFFSVRHMEHKQIFLAFVAYHHLWVLT